MKARFYCEGCGSEVKAGATSCPSCGSVFTAVRCPECGFEGRAAEFKAGCPVCGYMLRQQKASPTQRPGRAARRPLPSWFYRTAVIVLLAAVLTLLSLILFKT